MVQSEKVSKHSEILNRVLTCMPKRQVCSLCNVLLAFVQYFGIFRHFSLWTGCYLASEKTTMSKVPYYWMFRHFEQVDYLAPVDKVPGGDNTSAPLCGHLRQEKIKIEDENLISTWIPLICGFPACPVAAYVILLVFLHVVFTLWAKSSDRFYLPLNIKQSNNLG